MLTDHFLGEIIVESLRDETCLKPLEDFLVKKRSRAMPGEKTTLWHIHRYRLPKAQVLAVAPLIEQGFSSGEWYVHFFSELNNDMIVIMKGRTFRLPKHRDASWDEMIAYGESVGVGRRWTQSIPIRLPD